MKISLIVAVSENNVIGRNNDLPWHLPADMKYFKEKTMGHVVIMGRKNFESIPARFRPFQGRTNVVITRQKDFYHEGIWVASSLEQALQFARDKGETECFIIGGGEIFRQSIDLCERIYLTRIHHPFDGDVFFPELNLNDWNEISRTDYRADEKNKYDFSFIVLERVKSLH